jgi:hypothetical protein
MFKELKERVSIAALCAGKDKNLLTNLRGKNMILLSVGKKRDVRQQSIGATNRLEHFFRFNLTDDSQPLFSEGDTMTDLDWAYLAGFFDGEGCIVIQSGISGFQKSLSHRLQISIGNTYKPVMDWIKKEIRLGSLYGQGGKKQKKVCWNWYCRGNQAAFILRNLLPYLKVKRAQAELAFQFLTEREILKIGRRLGVSSAEIAKREWFKKSISALNQGKSYSIEEKNLCSKKSKTKSLFPPCAIISE